MGKRKKMFGFLLAGFLLAVLSGSAFGEDTEKECLSLLYEEKTVVTGSAIAGPPIESPSIISIFTQDQIKALGVRTIPELLEVVPGFNPWRSIAGDWWPGPRGVFDSNRSFQVMIDGVSINNQFLGSPYWTYDLLDLERFSRIEIVRGPGSALYGSNAFLAVINCITRENPPEGGRLRTTLGTYGTLGMGISRIARNGETTIDVGASGMSSEGSSRSYGPDSYGKTGLTNNGNTRKDFFLKLSNPDGWSFVGSHVRSGRGGYVGYFGNVGNHTFFERENTMVSLSYKKPLKKGGDISFKAFWNRFYDREMAEAVSPGGTFGGNGVTYPLGATEEDISDDNHREVQVVWNTPAGKYHFLTFQLGYSKSALTESGVYGSYDFPGDPNLRVYIPNMYPNPETFSNQSFVFQDDFKFGSRSRLVLGVRQDHHSLFGNRTSPRIGLIHRINDTWTGKLLYGEAFRNPDFHEITVTRSLQPEKIQSQELQIVGEIGDGWLAKVNLFQNLLTNRIESAATVQDYKNVGKTKYDGLEMELLKRLKRWQEIFANFSYYRLVHESTHPQGAPGVPHNRLNAGYRCKADPWELCLWGTLTSRQQRNWADPEGSIDGLKLVHFSARHRGFLAGKGDLMIQVRNVFNQPYEFVPAYYATPVPFPQTGREISMEMAWELP